MTSGPAEYLRRGPDGSRRRLRIDPAYAGLSDFALSLPELWEEGRGNTIFSKRNTVRLFTEGETVLAVKRFARLHGPKRLIYTYFRSSKGARAFDYSFRYNAAGIPTPAGVACLEVYRGRLLSDVYLLTLRSDGTELFGPLVDADDFDRPLAAGAAHFILRMHRAGIMHRDPNMRNILHRRLPDGTVRYEAIDINRSAFCSRGWTRAQIVRNLARLTHRRDLLKFMVETYAAEAGVAAAPLYAAVEAAVRRIERNRALRHRLGGEASRLPKSARP